MADEIKTTKFGWKSWALVGFAAIAGFSFHIITGWSFSERAFQWVMNHV